MIGKIISAAAVFTAAAGVTAMKKKNICPVCEVKKIKSKCLITFCKLCFML